MKGIKLTQAEHRVFEQTIDENLGRILHELSGNPDKKKKKIICAFNKLNDHYQLEVKIKNKNKNHFPNPYSQMYKRKGNSQERLESELQCS